MSRTILNIDGTPRTINPRNGTSIFVDLSSNQSIGGNKRFLNNLITNSDVNFNTTANLGRIIFNSNEPAGSGSQIVSIYTQDEIDGLGWFFDSVGNLYYLGGGLSPVKIMLSGGTGNLTILNTFNSGNITSSGTISCVDISSTNIIYARSINMQPSGFLNVNNITSSETTGSYQTKIALSNEFIDTGNSSLDIIATYIGFGNPQQDLSILSKYMFIKPLSDGNFDIQINNIASKVLSTNWSTLTLTTGFNLALGSKNITTTGALSSGAITSSSLNASSGTIQTTGTISGGAINGTTITASTSFNSDLITAITGTATKNSIMMDNQFYHGTNGSIDLKAHFVGFPYITQVLDISSKYMAIVPESDGNFSIQINNVVGKLLYTDFTNKIIKTDWSWKWYDASGIFQASILNTGDIAGKTLTASGNITSTAIIQTSGSIVAPTTKATLFEAILLNTYRNKIQMSNLFFNPDVASMDLVAQYVGFAHPALTLDIYSKYFFINPLTTGNVGFGINNISGYFLYTDWATRRVISEYTVGFRTAPFSSGYRYQTFLNNVTEIGSITMLTGSTIAFNNSSDYRLKQDIKPLEKSLERLMKLQPKSYRFIKDVEDGQDFTFDGFLAHEVSDIIPMAVSGVKDDPENFQQMDYSKLTPLLTGAVQELNKEVEELKIYNKSLLDIIDKLIIRVEKLEYNLT